MFSISTSERLIENKTAFENAIIIIQEWRQSENDVSA